MTRFLSGIAMYQQKFFKPQSFLRKYFILFVVLIVAFVIRLWGISYDLPYIYHPDEPWPVRIGYQMLLTRDFNPHFYHWPSLIIYVNMFVQGLYYIIGKTFHIFHSLKDVSPLVELGMGITYSPIPNIIILIRLLTVFIGVGTTYLTIKVGEKLTGRVSISLLAGLTAAVSPSLVSLNRFITPDSYATFFALGTFLASIYIIQRGSTWDYGMAGVCLGLAVASKYNSGLIVIVIIIAHFMRTGAGGWKDYRLFFSGFLALAVFFLAMPYSILDFPAFWEGLKVDSQHYATGHAGMEGNTLRWYIEYLWTSLGPILIFAVAGIFAVISSRKKELYLLATFPVIYFLFISRFIVRNDRTIMTILPFIILLAWVFIWLMNDELKKRDSFTRFRKGLSGLIVLIMAGSILYTSYASVTETSKLIAINSRETARVWITNNIPRDSKIGFESYAPFIDPQQYLIQGFARMIDNSPDWYIENGFEYLVFSEGMYGRFFKEPDRYKAEIESYNQFFNNLKVSKFFNDGNYEVRIYQIDQPR